LGVDDRSGTRGVQGAPRGHHEHSLQPGWEPPGDGGTDSFVKLWDATSREELLRLTGHEAEVWNLAFSPDGRFLATSSTDGTARVWVLDVEELMEIAEARVTRSLTDEECRQYLHADRCPTS
jgi:WD40 repeat protein